MSIRPTFCPKCISYLLEHKDYVLRSSGWRYCPTCNWCCNKEGNNLLTKKEELQNGKENEKRYEICGQEDE